MIRIWISAILCFVGLVTAAEVAVTDTVDTWAESLRLHLRVMPDGAAGASRWGVRWLVEGDPTVYYVCVAAESETAADPAYGYGAEITAGFIAEGRDSVTDRHRYCQPAPPSRSGMSLIVNALDGHAVVKTGSDRIVLTAGIAPTLPGRCIITSFAEGGSIVRRSLDVVPRAEAAYMAFGTTEALYDYLRASSDKGEGVWAYYDRTNDPTLSRTGGRYRLATVADGAGGYDIIYLDGASEQPDLWRPGRIKGRLRPTAFRDMYDMVWTQPSGREVADDVSAMIDGNLLTLLFPLWKTTVRLSRVPNVNL